MGEGQPLQEQGPTSACSWPGQKPGPFSASQPQGLLMNATCRAGLGEASVELWGTIEKRKRPFEAEGGVSAT